MLIPQFSLRWMLGLTVVCALIFWIVRSGLTGNPLAGLIAMAIAAALIAMLVYAVAFAALWPISLFVMRFDRRAPKSDRDAGA